MVLAHILLESTLVLIIRWVSHWLYRQLRSADIPRDTVVQFTLELLLAVTAWLPFGSAAMLTLVFLFVGALAASAVGALAAVVCVVASFVWGAVAINDWHIARAIEDAR